MSEIHENVSIWAKLYKRWEKVESDRRSIGTRPASGSGTHMSAMEIELRALGARVDTAFNEAWRTSHSEPAAEKRKEQHYLG